MPDTNTPAEAPMTAEELNQSLNAVIDPEIHIGIVDLGLIYKVVAEPGHADVTMTWTSFACPYGPVLVEQVREHCINSGFSTADVHVVFQPPWDPRTMASDEVKMRLGLWDAIDEDSFDWDDDDDEEGAFDAAEALATEKKA